MDLRAGVRPELGARLEEAEQRTEDTQIKWRLHLLSKSPLYTEGFQGPRWEEAQEWSIGEDAQGAQTSQELWQLQGERSRQ